MSNRNVVLVAVFAVLAICLCVVVAGAVVLGFGVTVPQSAAPTAPVAITVPAEATDDREASSAEDEADATPGDLAPATSEPTAAPQETAEPSFSLQRDSDFEPSDLDQLFEEVWPLVKEEFDGELPDDEILKQAVIQAVLETLDDPFTRYAPPDVAERMREDLSGSFEGIGAFVSENEQGLTEIVRPMDGQPADLAGLKAGDVVIAVDGESMIGSSLEEVIALIRGPRDTEVTLTVEREGVDEPIDVMIVRQRIEIPIIESELLESNIGYVRLTSFNRNAAEQLFVAVQALLVQDPDGLILDLRDNPGGFLDQSIAVADLFLPEGVVLYERSMTLGLDQVFSADDGDIAEEIPLVVLVNAGSASASEIVAGALQDNGRAVLIGEQTFGKGSVQQSHTLSDGSEIRITIARWYVPSNQSIDEVGIAPDIVIETPEDLGGEEDVQLQEAIEYLLGEETDGD